MGTQRIPGRVGGGGMKNYAKFLIALLALAVILAAKVQGTI